MLRATSVSLTNLYRFMRNRAVALSFFLALLAAALATPTWAQSRQERVSIIEVDAEPVTEYWRYSPAMITVPVGTTVTWRNTGRSHHTVTSAEGFFDSGYMSSGSSWSYEFDTPGVYNYFCVPYPWIKGTVVVRGRSETATPRSASVTTPVLGPELPAPVADAPGP